MFSSFPSHLSGLVLPLNVLVPPNHPHFPRFLSPPECPHPSSVVLSLMPSVPTVLIPLQPYYCPCPSQEILFFLFPQQFSVPLEILVLPPCPLPSRHPCPQPSLSLTSTLIHLLCPCPLHVILSPTNCPLPFQSPHPSQTSLSFPSILVPPSCPCLQDPPHCPHPFSAPLSRPFLSPGFMSFPEHLPCPS